MSWAWSEFISPINLVTGVVNIEYIFSVHLDTSTPDYLAVTLPFSYTVSPVTEFTQLSATTSLTNNDFSYDVKGGWMPSTSVEPYAALFAVSGKIGVHEIRIVDGYCTNKKGDRIGTPTQEACENSQNNHTWHAEVVIDTAGHNQSVAQTFTNDIPCFGAICTITRDPLNASADVQQNVPEPASIALLAIGLLGFGVPRRKIFKRKAI